MFIALSVLLAAACLVPALAKLSAHPKMLASASHFGIPWSRYRLIGVAELARRRRCPRRADMAPDRDRSRIRNVPCCSSAP